MVKRGDQRFAHFEFGDGLFDIKVRVDPECFSRCLDRPLIARGIGAQCVLDPVAKLPGDLFGNVDRVLADEIDPDAFRTDQPDHLLHLVEQRLRGIVEQQVRFIKEEHQPGLFGIAHFGQRLEQFAHQPQQKGGIELGILHQLISDQHVDQAFPAFVAAQEIVDLERGLAKKLVRALAFKRQQLTLDRADTGL